MPKNDIPKLGASWVTSLPQPAMKNAEEYLKAYIGYIYTAVGAITQEVASIDLHLYKATFTKKGPTTQEIYEHPALSVLHYANSISTLYDVMEATQTYLDLTGEAFWVAIRDGDGTPRELWPVRPDWIKVIPSADKVIDHYNYYAGGVASEVVEIPRENIIPFKYFHPLNPYRGKGPTQAAALPFDILNFAGEYNRNFFFNSALPSMVFSTDQKISQEAVKRFLNQWQSSFGGRSKSNKVAFLGQGLKLDKASFGAKELDFNEQLKTMRDDVLAVFKVPKTVLGLTDDVNRANADATTRAFMERVVTPRMRKFVDSLNEFYLPMFTKGDNTLFFDFTDPSPEDVELKLKRYENARKYNWMTPNEIRAEENLEPVEGGDDLFPQDSFAISPTDDSEDVPETTNPNEEDNDKPKKPTEDEPKGLRGVIAKIFDLKPIENKTYNPPAYLQKRILGKRPKHMIRIPVKRLEKIEEEEMAVKFVAPLKKFISELIAKDDYSPLKDKKGEEDKFSEVLEKAMEEVADKKKVDDYKKTMVEKRIKEGSGWDDEKKDAYWKELIENVEKHEKRVIEASQTAFKKQEKMVLNKLYDNMKSWRRIMGMKATVPQVLPSANQLHVMWASLEAMLSEIYEEQGNAVLADLDVDDDFNITTEFASQYLEEYSGTLISGIDDTTLQALRDTLSIGFDAGEGVDKLAGRVRDVFAEAGSVRAIMIARSEVIRASNTASVEAYRQSGVVVAKEWLAERDTKTCPFCLDLDGKAIGLSKNYYDKGDTATVDGQTMSFDYTDIGEPPAHTSCRCTVIPVVSTSLQGGTDYSTAAQDLVDTARSQDKAFKKSVDALGKELDAKVKHGPVKKLDRLLEKIDKELSGVDDPIAMLMDTNRSTLLISDPADFNKVVTATREEFGNTVRVKNKFGEDYVGGYRSAIINVKGAEGGVSEVAVTTEEMWDAKTVGGGDRLYNLVRSGKDPSGKFAAEMKELYTTAWDNVQDRLDN